MPTKKKKTTVSKAVITKKSSHSSPAEVMSAKKRTSIKITRNKIIIFVIAIIVIALLYYYRSFFVAAVVNGQPISRFSVIQQLEKQNGKKTLDNLVTKTLVLQAMEKKNITVSDAEVKQEVAKIESALTKQEQTLDSALAAQGLTRTDLMEQIKIQKMVEKLFGPEIKVTDAEVDKYIEDNKEALPQGTDQAQLKAQVRKQLEQQKLTEKFQAWVAGLQKDAKIEYFVKF